VTFGSDEPNRGDLRPITPRKAMSEWLDVIDADTSGSTADSYRRRVTQFVEWCEAQGILNLNTLDGRDIKRYRDYRAPSLLQTSLKNDLRNRGVRIAKVAARVDAMPDTIRAYYDKADLGEELARRRDELSEAGL